MVPNLIVIGAPRSGTTLLYNLFDSHKKIYVPKTRKEIYYFNKNLSKGLDWYKSFFSNLKINYKYYADITPTYLYLENLENFKKTLGKDVKIIVVIRNPIKRLISDYHFRKRIHNYSKNINEFVRDYDFALSHGFYLNRIKSFKNIYKKNLLILRYDEFFKNDILEKISFFLGIEVSNFDSKLLSKKVNSSFVPANKILYGLAFRVSRFLLKNDNYLIRNFLKNYFKKFLHNKKKLNLEKIDTENFEKIYSDEIFKIKNYLQLSDEQTFDK